MMREILSHTRPMVGYKREPRLSIRFWVCRTKVGRLLTRLPLSAHRSSSQASDQHNMDWAGIRRESLPVQGVLGVQNKGVTIC